MRPILASTLMLSSFIIPAAAQSSNEALRAPHCKEKPHHEGEAPVRTMLSAGRTAPHRRGR